jgi:hopanoid biosynthesis associated RND transporter like protein HpnN
MQGMAPYILIVALLSAGAAAMYAIRGLRVDTDLNNLVSQELPFRRTETLLREQFPKLFEVLVVVLDAETPEAARTAALALTAKLGERTDLLQSVRAPRADSFLEKHGLLFEDLEDLEDITERLAEVQPLLGTLRRDGSLRGLFSALDTAYEDKAAGSELDLVQVTGRVDATIRATLSGESRPFSWRAVLQQESQTADDRRQFVIANPVVDTAHTYPLQEAVEFIRSAWAEVPGEVRAGVRMRLTGGAALSHEELTSVLGSMLFIGLAVTVLVGVVLIRGLRSLRLVAASLVTVAVGLAWTAAVATVVLGRLNIVSATFGVLYMGLSVDHAIHICLRYREGVLRQKLDHVGALCASLQYVGGSLVIATVTTAVGFFAFVPTAYSGVSDLGLISGAGMFISLFANVMVLPAMLALFPLRPTAMPTPSSRSRRLREFPIRYPRYVLMGSIVVVTVAVALIPSVRFDANPLNLNNPDGEAVRTFRHLLATSKTPPWTLHVLAENETQAAAYAEAMRALPVTSAALSWSDLVPDQQDEKLALLEDAAFSLGVGAAVQPREPPSMTDQISAINGAAAAIDTYLSSETGQGDAAARGLRERMGSLLTALEGRGATEVADRLEQALLGTLPETLGLLDSALTTEGFDEQAIPPHIAEQWVNEGGFYRAEAFPTADLNDMTKLREYALAVEAVVPAATGTPIAMLRTGDVVVQAFGQAMLYAFAVSILILLFFLRSLQDVAFVLLPLVMATVLTGALMVVFGMSFNFANVIALPMLFGIGIDNGVHIVHRFREVPPGRAVEIHLLQTSTARGVVFSTLTTTAAFGSLALSHHAGTASLGTLSALGMSITLVGTLITLPALLTWLSDRRLIRTTSKRAMA